MPWASDMSRVLSKDFMTKIARAMQDEEIDVYTLSLYCMNASDLAFFSESDQLRVKEIFRMLIDDTRRHAELLKLILELGEKK